MDITTLVVVGIVVVFVLYIVWQIIKWKWGNTDKEMVKEKAKGGILDIFTNISEWFNERRYKDDDDRKF